jgi:hypothetical protein
MKSDAKSIMLAIEVPGLKEDIPGYELGTASAPFNVATGSDSDSSLPAAGTLDLGYANWRASNALL